MWWVFSLSNFDLTPNITMLENGRILLVTKKLTFISKKSVQS